MSKVNTSRTLKKALLTTMPVQAMAVGLPAINVFVSSIIIGNALGTTALAAIGFFGPVKYAIAAVSTILAMGSQLLCGRFLGRGDSEGIRKVFSSNLILCVIFGLIITAVMYAFPTGIAVLLGAKDELLPLTAEYIRGQAFGSVFIVMMSSLIPFLQLDQEKTVPIIAIVVMVVSNILANYLNVTVLNRGMFGAGLSIALANVLAALICLAYFFFKSKAFKFSFKCFSIPETKEIFILGAPNAIDSLCFIFRDRVFNSVLLGLGGTVAVSANSVAANISNCIGATVEGGYSGTANILSSILVGERDVDGLRSLPTILVKTITPFYFVAYAAVFVFAKPLALLFGANPADIATYVFAIRVFNLWYLSNIFKNPSISIYRAMGMTTLASGFYLVNNLIAPLIDYWGLARIFGISVVYASPIVGEAGLIISLIIYYSIKMHRLPHSLMRMTYIPRNLGIAKEDRLVATIFNKNDAVAVSQKIIDFCKSKGFSGSKSYHCGLALEEIAVYIIDNGFREKNILDPNVIDVKAIYENDSMTLVMRDNCKKFNIDSWLELHNDESGKGTDVRILDSITSKMEYKTTVGLNMFTAVVEK